jgi:ABC-type sulfate transport system permease component
MMSHKLAVDLAVTCVVPPLLTGLWLIFVYLNNRWVERKGGGTKIAAHPWRNLINMFAVSLFLTVLDLFRK